MTYANADRIASTYGTRETNPLPDGGHDWDNFEQDAITLHELARRGGRISRLRMLTEPGTPFLDVSYCHGILPNGRNVRLNVAPPMLRKGRGSEPYMSDMIAWAKDEGVHGKSIGMLDRGVWSILH